MAEQYLIGVDVGTNGSKGVLVDLVGQVKAYNFREHAVHTPKPGWCEQDGDAIWWEDLRQILLALVTQSGVDPRAVAAVGVSATCPDLLPVDEAGHPVFAGVLYSDNRASAEIQWITQKLGAERIQQVVGRPIPPDSVGAKVIWLRDNEPKVFERTRMVHNASSYLTFKLTGEAVIDQVCAGGNNPFFSPVKRRYDAEVCAELGVSPDLFPPVKWASEIAGGVTAQAAKETGLAEGTPVIVGTCDATAEVLSTGAVAPGDASLLYGSTMIMGVTLQPRKLGDPVMAWPGPIPAFNRAGFGMSASAALTRWFRDRFGQMEREAEAKLGIDAYRLLSDEAGEIPAGSEGLIVLPYFAGERSPIFDARARGMILGLTLSHTRRHIYRALLEGVAYGLRHGLECQQKDGVTFSRIVATGGGTKSAVWTQIVSDVIGYDQQVLLTPWGAPYGDAFLAGYGKGIFKDLMPLRDTWVQGFREVKYDPARKQLYDRYYGVYRGLYEKLKDDMHALAALSTASA
jgi:xylulokinase